MHLNKNSIHSDILGQPSIYLNTGKFKISWNIKAIQKLILIKTAIPLEPDLSTKWNIYAQTKQIMNKAREEHT